MAEFSFWFIIAVTVLSAAVVVLSNQLIYSAIALLATLFGVAGIYVFLWADFIAGVQLLVYIGGILVLIIFGIILGVILGPSNLHESSFFFMKIFLYFFIAHYFSFLKNEN